MTYFYNVISNAYITGNYTNVSNISVLGELTIVGYQGLIAGYTSGGLAPPYSNVVDKFPFATDSNSIDFGDLTTGRYGATGHSSTSFAYSSGGLGPAGTLNIIDKFPFATFSNATDVGDTTVLRNNAAGQDSSTHGYGSGGSTLNTIDKFPFATNSNATDVGDLTITRSYTTGQSSEVSGYTSGGNGPPGQGPVTNVIDKFPFATNANATDVGDLTVARNGVSSQSSITKGYTCGGSNGITTNYNTIDSFPFASNINATDVGDVTVSRILITGHSSTISGYNSSGFVSSGLNIIEKFPFSVNANATDVGDITQTRYGPAGQQN